MRWEQHGNPSSHWTTALGDQWFYVFLGVLAIVHLTLAANLPPADDELYYWAWSRQLQLSYFDHPPLVALLIRISTAIFGNSMLGIRFFAVAFTCLLLWTIGSWSRGKSVVLALALTPIGLLGAILMTPDTPFLLCWALYVSWLASVNQTFFTWSEDPIARVYREAPIQKWRWVFGGLLLGLGLLSKYTMVLAIPTAAWVLYSRYRLRAWASGFLIHLVVAFVVALPVLFFNIEHHFIPFQFQWGHALAGDSEGFFWRFIGSQAALVGLLPFLMLPWMFISAQDLNAEPRLHVCFYFFLVPFVFALFQATKNYVEANWAMMAYLTFWPIAQQLFARNTIRWLGLPFLIFCFLPAFVVAFGLLIHLAYPLKWIKPDRDRLGRLVEQKKIAEQLAHDLVENHIPETIYSPTYQWVSYLRYVGLHSEQIHPGTRPSNFSLEAKPTCELNQILVFAEANDPIPALQCFPKREILRDYPIKVRGETLSILHLVEYSKE